MKQISYEDALVSHASCVYCLEFSDGKRYVGKTRDLGDRMKLYLRNIDSADYNSSKVIEALSNNGGFNNITIYIVVEIQDMNKYDIELCLSILEIKYIREYDCLWPKGYNVSPGGEVLGIPIEYLATNESQVADYYSSSKSVLAYDISGKFICEYPSIARCAYERGVEAKKVSAYLGLQKPYNNVYYRLKRYNMIPQRIDVPEVKMRVRYKDVVEERHVVKEYVHNRSQACLVYDLNGDFVAEYKSRTQACHELMNHKTIPWGEYVDGYIMFRKESDDYPRKIEDSLSFRGKVTEEVYRPVTELKDKPTIEFDGKTTNKRRWKSLKLDFPINQFTLDGEFVAQHKSIKAASEYTGISYSSIYACIKKNLRKSGGFIWRKA